MTITERIEAARATGKNVGGTERVVRGTLGPALVAVGVVSLAGVVTLAAGTAGLAAGAVLVLAGARMTQTAITQKCYMNALLGRNSCRFQSTAGQSAASDSPASTRR